MSSSSESSPVTFFARQKACVHSWSTSSAVSGASSSPEPSEEVDEPAEGDSRRATADGPPWSAPRAVWPCCGSACAASARPPVAAPTGGGVGRSPAGASAFALPAAAAAASVAFGASSEPPDVPDLEEEGAGDALLLRLAFLEAACSAPVSSSLALARAFFLLRCPSRSLPLLRPLSPLRRDLSSRFFLLFLERERPRWRERPPFFLRARESLEVEVDELSSPPLLLVPVWDESGALPPRWTASGSGGALSSLSTAPAPSRCGPPAAPRAAPAPAPCPRSPGSGDRVHMLLEPCLRSLSRSS
mmetsp:Transcript_28290/g.76157  ORF Transcript_28290/g.76157 Transcript_28290/m.76157 type:complete len:302 (-) Transcript_28290:608-1513(-)